MSPLILYTVLLLLLLECKTSVTDFYFTILTRYVRAERRPNLDTIVYIVYFIL